MDDFDTPSLTFITAPKLIDQISGTRKIKIIPIYPQGEKWNFKLLSCLINEIDNFTRVKRRFFLVEKNQDGNIYKFTFVHCLNAKYKLFIEIAKTIEVSASADWLLSDWDLLSCNFWSNLRSQNRTRKKPVLQTHYYYSYHINKPTAGTIAMLNNIPVLYTGEFDYSNIFHAYAKKLISKELLYDSDTKFIHDYFNIFILPKNKEVNSLQFLKKKIKGKIILNVIECKKKEDYIRFSMKIKSIMLLAAFLYPIMQHLFYVIMM